MFKGKQGANDQMFLMKEAQAYRQGGENASGGLLLRGTVNTDDAHHPPGQGSPTPPLGSNGIAGEPQEPIYCE